MRVKYPSIQSNWSYSTREKSYLRGFYKQRKQLRDKNKRPLSEVIFLKTYKYIPENWIIHHLDGDRSNNRIDNLIAIPKCLHKSIHRHISDNQDPASMLPRRKDILRYLRDLQVERLKRFKLEIRLLSEMEK